MPDNDETTPEVTKVITGFSVVMDLTGHYMVTHLVDPLISAQREPNAEDLFLAGAIIQKDVTITGLSQQLVNTLQQLPQAVAQIVMQTMVQQAQQIQQEAGGNNR